MDPVNNRQRYIFFSNSIEARFGFCEDCDKIVYGLKHSLTLVRKTYDDAILRGAAAAAGKGSLDKMCLMPYVIPAYAGGFPFSKLLNQKLNYQ